MTVLLVHGSRTREASLCVLRQAANERLVYEADSELPEAGGLAERINIHSLLDADDLRRIHRFCQTFQAGWFILDGNDLSRWRNRSLGAPLSVEDLKFLLPLARNLAVVAALFRRYPLTDIFLGDGADLLQQVWISEAARHGIRCVVLERDAPRAIEPAWSTNPPRETTAQSAVTKPAPTTRSFVPARLRGLVSLAAARIRRTLKGTRIVLIATSAEKAPRLLRTMGLADTLLKRRDRAPVYLAGPLTDALRRRRGATERKKATRHFSHVWQKFSNGARDPAIFSYDGIEITPHVIDWCEHQMKQVFPANAAEIAVTETALRLIQPDLIVAKHAKRSNTVMLWSTVARERGIPILVGLTDLHADVDNSPLYLPPIADHILAAGPSAITWCEKRGIERSAIHVTGDHARSDAAQRLNNTNPAEVRSRYGFAHRPLILFADSPFCLHDTFFSPFRHFEHLRWMKELAGTLPEAEVVVKFHPPSSTAYDEGPDALQRHIDFLRDGSPANLTILPQRSDISPVLGVTDILVTPHSTVGYESMAANIPTIFLRNPRATSVPWAFEDPDAARFVITSDDLIDACRTILRDFADYRARVAGAQRRQWEFLFAPPADPSPVVDAMLTGTTN